MAKEDIEGILDMCRNIVVVGLSDDPSRPSYRVASYMKDHGYKIVPVNPNFKEVLSEVCYPNLTSVECGVDLVDIFRRSEAVNDIVEEAIKMGAKVIWMQEGVVNEEAAAKARHAGLKVIMDKCIMKEHGALRSSYS